MKIRVYRVEILRSMSIVAVDKADAKVKFLKYLMETLLAEDVKCELQCEAEELEK